MFDDGWSEFDAAATLDAAVEFDVEENRAALGKLCAAVHFADLHAELPPAFRKPRTSRGGERLVVYGGDGCPAIAEFAPAEFGALLKMSSGAAAAYIGDGLALRHRLPRIWAKTKNGQAIVWRARAVARACLKLSKEAAALVDERVVGVIDTLSAYGLRRIVDAVLLEVDPEAAREAAEERARERGVWVQPSSDHGTKTIWVKAAIGDVIRFDATIDDIAWALRMLGDTDSLSARRAKAIGWIADPAAYYELLAAARYLAAHPQPAVPDPSASSNLASSNRSASWDPSPGSSATDAGSSSPGPNDPEPGRSSPDSSDPEPASSGTATVNDAGSLYDAASASASIAADGAESEEYWPATVEPGLDDEADRDAPHPSVGEEPHRRDEHVVAATADVGIDLFSRQHLASRLAAIRQSAGTGTTSIGPGGRGSGRVVLYVHLTDQALISGDGILRVEDHGPLLAGQLKELLGHDQVVLKPVIDLNQPIHVNAYEIPTRIRERVRLAQPVDTFPYGTAETTPRTDLDHIQPYDPHGPPGQTNTTSLTPATRFHHRVKTHGRWRLERTPEGALQWTTPNGFRFRVDHSGTHRIRD